MQMNVVNYEKKTLSGKTKLMNLFDTKFIKMKIIKVIDIFNKYRFVNLYGLSRRNLIKISRMWDRLLCGIN